MLSTHVVPEAQERGVPYWDGDFRAGTPLPGTGVEPGFVAMERVYGKGAEGKAASGTSCRQSERRGRGALPTPAVPADMRGFSARSGACAVLLENAA